MTEPSSSGLSSQSRRRFWLLFVAPSLLLLSIAVLPLVLGVETLYTRDVLSSHYPMKVAQAEVMRRGELPLLDPYRAGGQPLLGNPNAVPLYPDNLLYLLASPLWALNAHFWLHLLAAPFAGYWLGRAWGLGRPAAWGVGAVYATSGFFLSLFNLYNLIAGAALAPALIAACLDATGERRRRTAVVEVGALWGLLLLGGDPLFAALGLGLAIAAVLVRFYDGKRERATDAGARRRRELLRLLAALALGTLLAAPMLIELWRILPLSFRGYWRYSVEAALTQSWDPRTVLEWGLPLVFGRPDFSFWGTRFFGGNPPLLFSVYPGLLAIVLLAAAGRPRSRSAWWAWGAVLGGLFLALGAFNPLVRLLYELPGASVLRYPIKFWLAVAIGAALLCGLGLDSLLAGRRRRQTAILLGLLAPLYAGLWLLLELAPPPLLAALARLAPDRLTGPFLAAESQRWSGLALATVVVVVLLGGALLLLRRRPVLGAALLLGVHVASQTYLLAPLLETDDVAPYLTPPAALELIPKGAVVVHGGHRSLFGDRPGTLAASPPRELFPDPRLLWMTRAQFAQLYPFAGAGWGLRYELNPSPEGLDSFFVVALGQAMARMSDGERLRLLAASGVDILLLDRELEPAARERVQHVATVPLSPLPLHVYRLTDGASPAQLVGTVRRAPHLNASLELLTADDFDPRTAVVLPGEGEGREGPPGTVTVLDDRVGFLEAEVSSEAGGVVVIQRAYLDLYRASLDGEPVATRVANLHRLGIEVPSGPHRLRLWIDRRPTYIALAVSLLALLALLTLLALALPPLLPFAAPRTADRNAADPEPGRSATASETSAGRGRS